MKTFATASLAAALALTLSACGGSTATENAVVANDVYAEDTLVTDNVSAVDPVVNDTALVTEGNVLANVADATANAQVGTNDLAVVNAR